MHKRCCCVHHYVTNLYQNYTLLIKFPKQLWIGWVASNLRIPTVKFWANFDNPFKITNYAKFCMSPSLDGTMPESVISHENNSPLTLYIEFHNKKIKNSWISLVPSWSSSIINACTIILALTYLKYKSRGKIHFHEKWKFREICVQFH